MVNDIDLAPDLPGGQVFDRAVIAPDASEFRDDFQGTAFSGMFDGNGFTVSNLTIVGQDYLGFVGATDDGGPVSNLGVVDANVVGAGLVIGILAGDHRGHVTNCYTTGTVSGLGDLGGLVGWNKGAVTHCYSTAGTVGGEEDVGGLVGENDGPVAHCYSTGLVIGEGDVGGLVGRNQGVIVQCYAAGSVWGGKTSAAWWERR